MEEEEHEVYGAEIPDEGEMDGDMDALHADVDMSTADDDAVKVLIKNPRKLNLFQQPNHKKQLSNYLGVF